MHEPSPKRVLHGYIEKTQWFSMIDSSIRGCGPDGVSWTIQDHVREGKQLPDKLRPGWLLRHASEEDLRILKNLKSDDLKNDWPGLWPPESGMISPRPKF